MHLYVIRHGESLGNIQQSNIANCALSPQGQTQAERILHFFSTIAVDRIYSSPLKRTIMTATPLAKQQGKNITLVPEMSEFFNPTWLTYGEYKWESCDQLLQEYPNVEFVERHPLSEPCFPQWPEDSRLVAERVRYFYDTDLAPYFPTNDKVVVIGHGASTGALRRLIYPQDEYPALSGENNAVVYEFKLDQAGQLEDMKVHTEHLAEYMSAHKNRNH